MKFSREELIDLSKAWIVISLAFAIVLSNEIFSLSFLLTVLISAITVGVGFLLHELAHKYVALRYGCTAEFRSFDQMLVFALLMSWILGIVFAAPGAVFISGNVNLERNGRISIAGPITNLVIALIFLLISFTSINNIFLINGLGIGEFGFFINTWLALFNMIPFWNFDGKKIFYWNKTAWITVVGIALVFLFV